jgi:mannose-6-phosphate isomerase-like protein (cupin superfamily)
MHYHTDPNAPHWSADLVNEASRARNNGQVGSRLVNETGEYRIWLIEIKPGERLSFHTHVLNYFWVATSAGRARSRNLDGRVVEVDYAPGDTRHVHFGPGEFMTHDLENIGSTVLSFTTVEDKRSPNQPLLLD